MGIDLFPRPDAVQAGNRVLRGGGAVRGRSEGQGHDPGGQDDQLHGGGSSGGESSRGWGAAECGYSRFPAPGFRCLPVEGIAERRRRLLDSDHERLTGPLLQPGKTPAQLDPGELAKKKQSSLAKLAKTEGSPRKKER